MMKRIIAIILLIGFVLLLINILIFKFMLELSWALYFIIVVVFIFTWLKGRKKNSEN